MDFIYGLKSGHKTIFQSEEVELLDSYGLYLGLKKVNFIGNIPIFTTNDTETIDIVYGPTDTAMYDAFEQSEIVLFGKCVGKACSYEYNQNWFQVIALECIQLSVFSKKYGFNLSCKRFHSPKTILVRIMIGKTVFDGSVVNGSTVQSGSTYSLAIKPVSTIEEGSLWLGWPTYYMRFIMDVVWIRV